MSNKATKRNNVSKVVNVTTEPEHKVKQIIIWCTTKPPEDSRKVMVDNGTCIEIACFFDGEWHDAQGCGYGDLVFRWAELPESCHKAVTPDWGNL